MVTSRTSDMARTGVTAREFRHALSQLATGVTVVTAERENGRVHGMTASSFTSVSLEPPLILVCVAEQAQLLTLIREKKRFGVNILKQSQHAVAEYFAQTVESAEMEAKLGIKYRWTPTGIPLLEDGLAHVGCNLVAAHVSGDHTIFVAEVESAEVHNGEPLVHFRGEYWRMGGRV